MIDTVLVAAKTVVSSKGDGPALDVSGAASRVFLLTLEITNIIEQESFELSIFSSADGAAWDAKPLVTYPQEFYRGEYPLLLDSGASRREVRARPLGSSALGRGVETPMFEFGLQLKEIPPDVLREASAEAKILA